MLFFFLCIFLEQCHAAGSLWMRICRQTSTPEMLCWSRGPSPWILTMFTCCCRVSLISSTDYSVMFLTEQWNIFYKNKSKAFFKKENPSFRLLELLWCFLPKMSKCSVSGLRSCKSKKKKKPPDFSHCGNIITVWPQSHSREQFDDLVTVSPLWATSCFTFTTLFEVMLGLIYGKWSAVHFETWVMLQRVCWRERAGGWCRHAINTARTSTHCISGHSWTS